MLEGKERSVGPNGQHTQHHEVYSGCAKNGFDLGDQAPPSPYAPSPPQTKAFILGCLCSRLGLLVSRV